MRLKQTQHKVAKLIIFAITLTIIGFAVGPAWNRLRETNVETSVVIRETHDSFMDGCDGYVLENGDKFNYFCWFSGNSNIERDSSIRVGDVVAYGDRGDSRFIRKADNGIYDSNFYYWSGIGVAIIVSTLFYINTPPKID